MAWNDRITAKQLAFAAALQIRLGRDGDVTRFEPINRAKAKILIDGLLEEVAAIEHVCPTCNRALPSELSHNS